MNFWMHVAEFCLSIMAMIVAVVAWWGGKNRVTQQAIDRVENHASKQHQEQETRIVTLETEFRHMIGNDALAKSLEPIYDKLNDNGKAAARLEAQFESLDKTLRTLTSAIQSKGLNQ